MPHPEHATHQEINASAEKPETVLWIDPTLLHGGV